MRYILCCLLLIGVTASAQAGKKGKAYVRVIEATSQSTRPGIPGAQVKTDYHLVIVWTASAYPESFFWRGEKGWLTCNMQRVHKAKKGGKTSWTSEDVSNDAIHKGDTLSLVPVTGGKFPVPAEVPASAKNTLYYKTAGSGWLSVKVNNIRKMADKLAE